MGCKGTDFVLYTQIVGQKKWKNFHFLSKNSVFGVFGVKNGGNSIE